MALRLDLPRTAKKVVNLELSLYINDLAFDYVAKELLRIIANEGPFVTRKGNPEDGDENRDDDNED
eukprot:gene7708-8546_t